MKTQSSIVYYVAIFSLFGIALWGCKACQDKKQVEDEMDVKTEKEDTFKGKTEGAKIAYSLPSPVEVAALIKKTGVNYNYEILNPTDKASNYTTTYKKGVNLGVYGADLGYAAMYEQTQEAVEYLNTIKDMSDDLGIIGAFEKKMIKRVDRNLGNRDSLIKIVTKAFSKADMYLKENERGVTSAYILAGGWIEALYLSTKIVESNPNKDIITRIGEQKISLDILISFLSQFKHESEELKNLLKELKELQDVYSDVKITYDYKPSKVDSAQQKVYVNTTSTVEITTEQLNAIAKKAKSIRSKIIS